MAVFNGYPVNYPQMYYQPTQQTPQQPSALIWVQGEAGAKSYLVAPNSTVALWDSENQAIYLKSADASGMPSIKTLDYTIRGASSPVAAQMVTGPDYATRADLEAVKHQVEILTEKLKEAGKHE